MNKKYLLFALSLGILTACDPIKDEADLDYTTMTADELLAGASFSQEENTIWFDFPQVTSVTIYAMRADGSENVLSAGKNAGSFSYTPSRGSDPLQPIYFRYVNAAGETVTATQNFTFNVAADLSPEIKLIASNDGSKVWKWNTNAPNGRIWGNMGNWGGMDGKNFALQPDQTWWGVTTEEEFLEQLNHSNTGVATGEESLEATMVISEEGTITCYDANGNQIRSGKFEIQNYDPNYSNTTEYCGILHTDPGTILFPFEINSGGNMPTDFLIYYLSPGRLVLVYPDTGEWNADKNNEGTFWQFYSVSDIGGLLTDNSSATWTWDDDNLQCWGNGGYGGFAYGGASSVTGNTWWGIPSTDLDQQFSDYGYGFSDGNGVTMTFNSDGTYTKSSGGNGTFTYDASETSDLGGYNEGKTCGRLYTTGDGILFNQRINAADHPDLPSTIHEFDIAYISDESLVLIAPSFYKSTGGESWQEGTFWRFKKVK